MKKKILYAEDRLLQARRIKNFLEQHNYSVSISTNQVDTLDLFEKFRPDLVIMDIHWGTSQKFEGVLVASEIQKRNAKLPIIYLTGLGKTEGLLAKVSETSFHSILKKPISSPETRKLLLQKVELALEKSLNDPVE